MRTKTLFVAAALGAVGTATAMAQVYSVNAVGYVNTEFVPGFTLASNPLDAGEGNNTVGKILAGVPVGTSAYKFDAASGAYQINTYLGSWTVPDMSFAPGEGLFVRNAGAQAFTVTFVGEVMQGTLTVPLVEGFQIVSSMVPQAGGMQTVLGYQSTSGDQVFTFDPATQAYVTHTALGTAWVPAEPTLKVGEAAFVNSKAAKNWTRDFSVNN